MNNESDTSDFMTGSTFGNESHLCHERSLMSTFIGNLVIRSSKIGIRLLNVRYSKCQTESLYLGNPFVHISLLPSLWRYSLLLQNHFMVFGQYDFWPTSELFEGSACITLSIMVLLQLPMWREFEIPVNYWGRMRLMDNLTSVVWDVSFWWYKPAMWTLWWT